MPGRYSLVACALALALSFGPALAPVAAQPPSPNQTISVPITQALEGIGNFAGQLAIGSIRVVNGQLVANGTLSGQVTDAAGNVLSTIVTAVAMPITNASGSCSILHLTLGPVDLTLLGLAVHLNQVVLDITAQTGAGNLLGNLLCSVANLLNGGGPLQALAAALNQLLAAL